MLSAAYSFLSVPGLRLFKFGSSLPEVHSSSEPKSSSLMISQRAQPDSLKSKTSNYFFMFHRLKIPELKVLSPHRQ